MSRMMLKLVNHSSTVAIRQLSLINTKPLILPTGTTVKNYLDEKQFNYVEGYASYMLECPICDTAVKQQNMVPQYCMHINKTTGSVKCPPCKLSGSWSDFDTWIHDKAKSLIVQPPINHELLDSLNSTEKFWSTTTPWKMSIATVMNKAMEQFGFNKITSEILQKFDVRTVVGKFPSPNGQEINEQCLAYPFSNGKNIVRVKVESITHKKAYFKPRQGIHGLFGWNLIKDLDKEVVLTANEFDAMAVYQATKMPALALPNGYHNLSPELLPQLEQFEKIILWLGSDPQAKQSTSNFAKKLNMNRCYTVATTNCGVALVVTSRPHPLKFQDGMNVKNAVHALTEGYDLNKVIQSAKLVAHNKILTFQELRDDVYSELVNAEQVAGVKWQRYPGLTKILKGHRPGELTILTGPTGSGKTTLISELSLDLCQQGVATLWGSFEVKNVRLIKMMMSQLSGIKIDKSLAKYSYWADRFEQLPLYFMNFYGSVDIETVIEVMTHAAYIYDIQHVVIDNLQFMIGSSVKMDDKYFLQNKAIAEFRKFSFLKNVHVSIVMHPRKEDSHVELQTSSISGSAKASQESDNILILQKLPKQPKYLQVAKNRFDGDLGRTVLDFDKNSTTFSGHFIKYANVQHHIVEDDTSSTFKESSIITGPKINGLTETQQPEVLNKSSVLKKSKPFWNIRSFKKDSSKAKK